MPGLNIYEAVNKKERESLVALCAATPGEFLERLRSSPPPEICHWRPGEFLVEQIVRDMSHGDAEIFLTAFSAKLRASDWTVIVLNLT